MLGLAFVLEGISWIVAFKEFKTVKGAETFWQSLHTSKDPMTFTVLFEDSAALLGVAVAFVGVFLGHQLNNPYLDGSASLIIGTILAVVAVLLAMKARDS